MSETEQIIPINETSHCKEEIIFKTKKNHTIKLKSLDINQGKGKKIPLLCFSDVHFSNATCWNQLFMHPSLRFLVDVVYDVYYIEWVDFFSIVVNEEDSLYDDLEELRVGQGWDQWSLLSCGYLSYFVLKYIQRNPTSVHSSMFIDAIGQKAGWFEWVDIKIRISRLGWLGMNETHKNYIMNDYVDREVDDVLEKTLRDDLGQIDVQELIQFYKYWLRRPDIDWKIENKSYQPRMLIFSGHNSRWRKDSLETFSKLSRFQSSTNFIVINGSHHFVHLEQPVRLEQGIKLLLQGFGYKFPNKFPDC